MMTQQEYKEMIHNIVVPESLPYEEINKFDSVMRGVSPRLIRINYGFHPDIR